MHFFEYDARLGIDVPNLETNWDDFSDEEQAILLERWEQIRGTIPSHIYRIEQIIIQKQLQLNVEDNFPISCRLNSEIAELASRINDLHIWYRTSQDIQPSATHH